jgi:hypothetical protein
MALFVLSLVIPVSGFGGRTCECDCRRDMDIGTKETKGAPPRARAWARVGREGEGPWSYMCYVSI